MTFEAVLVEATLVRAAIGESVRALALLDVHPEVAGVLGPVRPAFSSFTVLHIQAPLAPVNCSFLARVEPKTFCFAVAPGTLVHISLLADHPAVKRRLAVLEVAFVQAAV